MLPLYLILLQVAPRLSTSTVAPLGIEVTTLAVREAEARMYMDEEDARVTRALGYVLPSG